MSEDDAAAGTQARQSSLSEATNERPATGVSLDERTHYAHVRYAAGDHPGVIWYDPRDGREYLSLDVDTSLDALELEERVLTGVRLHGKRNVCGIVDPSEEWVLEIHHASKAEYDVIGDVDETANHVECYRGSEIFESQEAARDAAAEQVEAYADAPYRNAVEARLGDGDA